MNITPLIPDGYNGPIKQLTCRFCKHIFYVTMIDYTRLGEVTCCHECSQIFREEREKEQRIQSMPSIKTEPAFPQTQSKPVPAPILPRVSVIVPQPRTIDREKMTVEQLLEEAKMLAKTWRYKEALVSYEQAIQCDPE